jgi:hypothetical protein
MLQKWCKYPVVWNPLKLVCKYYVHVYMVGGGGFVDPFQVPTEFVWRGEMGQKLGEVGSERRQ